MLGLRQPLRTFRCIRNPSRFSPYHPHIGHDARKASSTAANNYQPLASSAAGTPDRPQSKKPPLSLLPLHHLVRSYAITALSSYPILLSPSLRILSFLAHSSSAFLNPDRNVVLHWLLKKTFYAQFCAGETDGEVKRSVDGLRRMGYAGVVLAYGKEIVLEKGEKLEISAAPSTNKNRERAQAEIQEWKDGIMKTVLMVDAGDFVGLKFSGAGRDVMRQLAARTPPCRAIEDATIDICDLAKARGVRLLFDAEQDTVQKGIDLWTLQFQQRYNTAATGKALVYGTYQAYLKSTPQTLINHLVTAKREGFTLGVKLVRGAYMASDPRHLFWATKEETDKAYDGICEALIRRKGNDVLRPTNAEKDGELPAVSFVLASHNQQSVKKAIEIRGQQTQMGDHKIDMAWGQLMGMADEVSCELVMVDKNEANENPNTYKYVVWGSVRECLKYLVRRAEENKDAVTRAQGTRLALKAELNRRIWGY